MNVLVYSGTGTSQEAVKHACYELSRLLSPYYAVSPCTASTLLNEPWPDYTAALVIPGGADLPYCSVLNGAGNERISAFVRKGGKYIGFCAGGYYGSAKCEFEEDNRDLAVVGPRELAFFEGVARGTAYDNFCYDSEQGARAILLNVDSDDENKNSSLENQKKIEKKQCYCYYNGGCVFVDADLFGPNVELLATYDTSTDGPNPPKLNVKYGSIPAAVIKCKVGRGFALLTGVHPEFSPSLLKSDPTKFIASNKSDVLKTLSEHDNERVEFLKYILSSIGLKVNNNIGQEVPSLTPLLLSALDYNYRIPKLLDLSIRPLLEADGRTLRGENDTFIFSDASSPFSEISNITEKDTEKNGEKIIDLNAIPKRVHVYSSSYPSSNITPFFNHFEYYDALSKYQHQLHLSSGNFSTSGFFGSVIMYAEVLTSTSTLLDKNITLLRKLPHGFTITGTIQVAGRGRGNNIWVSPPGCLMFSTVIKHTTSHLSKEVSSTSSVVFIQYLTALAIVEAILSAAPDLPVKLKWPNDIYVGTNSLSKNKVGNTDINKDNYQYKKVGGIIVNSSCDVKGEYIVVIGCGINVSNVAPTDSLNNVIAEIKASTDNSNIKELSNEDLLARVLTQLEKMYSIFSHAGFAPFEELYYSRWLHTDQIISINEDVTRIPASTSYPSFGLSTNVKSKYKIKGISLDYGMLKVSEINSNGSETGAQFYLRPDGNSFDMLNGLIKVKI